MVSLRRAVAYGIVVWLVPFLTAVAIFPIHDTNRPLFESIMPVSVVAIATYLGVRHLGRTASPSLRNGLVLGLLWLAICLVIDAPLMLLGGPMQMTIGQYLSDIGLTYLVIPIVTTGIAAARAGGGRVSTAP